jgi:hypothetical protein
MFIFTGEQPAYQCLEYNAEIGKYVFARPYLKEGPEFHSSWRGVEIVINARRLSTCLNALTDAGLVFDRLIESETNIDSVGEQNLLPEKWYSVSRAQLLPTTIIVKAHKPK